MSVPLRCPDCGEEGQIVIDYQLGEAACHNCASVVAMGLLENEQTRFDEDTTLMSADRSANKAAANSSSAAQAAEVHATATITKARQLFGKLRDRTGCPPNVPDFAADIYTQWIQKQARDNKKIPSNIHIQGACFLVAASLRRWPIQAHELVSYDSSLRLGDITRSVTQIIDELQLADDIRAVNRELFFDIACVYARRLELNLARFVGPISRMAAAYNKIVTSVPASPSLAVAASIYLCCKSKKVASAAVAGGETVAGDPRQFLDQILAATRHAKTELEPVIQATRDHVDALAEAAAATPATAHAAATATPPPPSGEPRGLKSAATGAAPETGAKRKEREGDDVK